MSRAPWKPLLLALTLAPALRADVIVPSSAFAKGAGNPPAEFHTDVRVFNPTSSPVNVTPIFYNQAPGGETVIEPFFTVPSRAQMPFDNILQSLFGQSLGAFGPIRFQTTAPIIVSTGTNNVNGCGNGSVSGQWIPGIDVGQAMKAGTLVQLGASTDPATGYRSNVVFMYPGTDTANVTAMLRRGDGTLVTGITLAPLGPNGFKQINGLKDFVGSPSTVTDSNLWLEFTSDQPVLAFASVINNASGDPFAVTTTAEPPEPVRPPVASYTVSASPTANQPVTFNDTSTNGPTTQLWSFGDGTIATSGSSVQHTYTAAGTYKTSHFAANAAGAAGQTADVVVGTSGAINWSVLVTSTGGTHWMFTPTTVTCRVGIPCQITWTTPAAENLQHGIGGISIFGVTQCDDGESLDYITPYHPCTVTFTPTSYTLNYMPAGGWQYHCTQTQCAPTQQVHDAMIAYIVIQP